jgi:prolyl oligopeptidase
MAPETLCRIERHQQIEDSTMSDAPQVQDRSLVDDENLWLEEIHDERALAWVEEQNQRTLSAFDAAALATTTRQILDVLDSTDRIPRLSKYGPYFYNFWKDAEHPRGLWRRTTLDSYRTPAPDWDVLLDVDELGRREKTEWVFAGVEMHFPDYRRALLKLSPDGGDAVAVREFDLESRDFVAGGFALPSAKSDISWVDVDTVLVTTDFGPGSLTTSGYPRQLKRWRRGQPIEEAELLHEAPTDHMALWAEHDHTVGYERSIVRDFIDFYHTRAYLLRGNDLVPIEVPEDAVIVFHREWLLINLRSDWQVERETFPAGSLLATKADDYLAGQVRITALFTPEAGVSLEDYSATRHHLLLTKLRDVASEVELLTPTDNGWSRQKLDATQPNQSVTVGGVDRDENDDFWLTVAGYLQPDTLQLGTVGSDRLETLKRSPSFFDESAFRVEQHFATSRDGTRVPYFQIAPNDLEQNGRNPTMLYGYGGFEVSLTPDYDGVTGRAWLEAGGVYVVANIRGGGEYGPDWHHAALRENRHRAYDDFAAVARDLIERGVTSPRHLGCAGGSNGGLLVGNMLTHYPELFGAIVCLVPLLDMKRYTMLSAGTSWIAEYGDPDKADDWAFIQTFSPYHNLRDGVSYPPVLFYTATSDDRVGPVQARKMAARMQARGIEDVLFYENREGGHAGSADNAQKAQMQAMSFEFFKMHLFGGNESEM